MKIPAIAAGALLLLTGTALADGFAPRENKFAPPPLDAKKAPGPHDWTGFYVGGHGGLSQGRSKWSTDGASRSSSDLGSTFGAHAGYNYQFNRGVVFGGETDVSR
ncbi:hypothetical protein J8I29_17165 [Labrys sp. LIt4]|uniref:hypothetical protein n=1 Tax=Labrys sp. LIt4 TaxID=2821355 RepID=UPI001ADF61E0|nr:hypothetical protein [Labrys sp. LIt4]MBP0581059.1 hypothetical protein [Labrys sp. LIt4]